MVPTLEIGQRVLVNRIGNRFGDPDVGDIIVFHPPDGRGRPTTSAASGDRATGQRVRRADRRTRPSVNFIKRVVGRPGRHDLRSRDGHVVSQRQAREATPFISGRADGGAAAATSRRRSRFPPDHYFMMGDNRGESDDSRFWGPVPRNWIIGGAFATYWPPKRIGLL